MKKLLTLAALLLALTACGSQEPSPEAAQQPSSEASEAAQEPSSEPSQPPTTEAQQLSTEDTCSEAEAIMTTIDSGMTDEQVAEMGSQLDDLATRASDSLQDPLRTMAAALIKGREEVRAEAAEDPAVMEELDDVVAVISEECGL
ncbi:hypothetical protein [Arthrobacter sp. L77]|uniref:hypothetical protein n=1 Tax=Arthrobacter sp. L77 TaxID=1496689 RepID=UPI0005B9CFBD|nr:hypothetical protein [Arthrobacter sp. L77]